MTCEASLVIVRLDDTSVPAGPATVLERVSAVSALSKYKDRDGCRDMRVRVWSGVFEPGARVSLTSGLTERIPRSETEPPTPQPLKLREPPPGAPTTPARALPNGRGFLRLVGSASTAPVAPTPPGASKPEPPPSEPPPAPEPMRMKQLDLFRDDE